MPLQDNKQKALTLRQRVRAQRSVQWYLNRIGQAWARECIARAPVHEYWNPEGSGIDFVGGRLKNSIRWVQTANNSGYLEMIYYGEYVETGTRQRQIYPRKQATLIFPWKAIGGWVFSKGPINHPAVAAHPFILDAWMSNNVQSIIAQMRKDLFVRRG